MRTQTEHSAKTLFVILMSILALCSYEAGAQTEPGKAEVKEHPGDAYPLDFCPVSGLKLAEVDKPAVVTHEGREIRFCCEGCAEEFKEKPDPYMAELAQAVIEKHKESYSIDKCVVSGEGLDSMGGAVEFVHANRLVRFCCEGCAHVFRKDPVKYMAKISAPKETVDQ